MKKIISLITVIAVIKTMFAVVPASAAVYVKVTSHHANAQLGADSTVTVPAPKSAEGYTREVFVWNNTSSLTPVVINVAE